MLQRDMRSPWIAHRREADGALQCLENHLLAVGRLSAGNASKLKFSMDDGACPAGLDGAGEVLGLLHDLGKYSQAFQDYLGSAVGLIDQDADDFVDAKQLRGRIDHSTAGAQYIWRRLSQTGRLGQLSGEILALCIASHHSGLIDCLSPDGQDNFTRRMNKPEHSAHLAKALERIDASVSSRLADLIDQTDLSERLQRVAHNIAEREHRTSGSLQIVQFKFGLLLRFLFSCLIDADRVDRGLCRFVWNGQRPGEWRGGQMGELSSDEVGHGDEVFDAAIAAGASASFLKRAIHRLDTTVVFACLETVEDARKMLGDRSAEALEGFQSAPAGPTEPALEQRLASSGVVALM
jgi:CRISPR-associated endonuclease Cas3-HD